MSSALKSVGTPVILLLILWKCCGIFYAFGRRCLEHVCLVDCSDQCGVLAVLAGCQAWGDSCPFSSHKASWQNSPGNTNTLLLLLFLQPLELHTKNQVTPTAPPPPLPAPGLLLTHVPPQALLSSQEDTDSLWYISRLLHPLIQLFFLPLFLPCHGAEEEHVWVEL